MRRARSPTYPRRERWRRPLCRGVADRQVGQLPSCCRRSRHQSGVHGQHVDHALRGRSLPADPALAPNAPPPTTARPPMTEVSSATRVRVLMPETVRGLPRRWTLLCLLGERGSRPTACGGEATCGGRTGLPDRVNLSRTVSERPKDHVSKTCVGATPPWVQIPPVPPQKTPVHAGVFSLLRVPVVRLWCRSCAGRPELCRRSRDAGAGAGDLRPDVLSELDPCAYPAGRHAATAREGPQNHRPPWHWVVPEEDARVSDPVSAWRRSHHR